MLKLSESLGIADYFTPSDWQTRCANNADRDFGSGGVMLIPDPISNYPSHLMINAEKESYLWILNRDSLGGVNGSGLVESSLQQDGAPQNATPGYWSSAAYWKYSSGGTTYYQIYYAPDDPDVPNNPPEPPLPLQMFRLNQSPPIISSPSATTSTRFCAKPHAPTPSISANGNNQSSGLLWAVESSNKDNPTDCEADPGSAILHAYDPISLTEYYNSGDVTGIGKATNFGVPTIFNGKVYMGTKGEVDVFSLCTASPKTCVH